MDRSVKVQSPADLNRFANGKWLDRTTMSADKSYVGTFDDIQERNIAILRRICARQAAATQPPSTVGGKVGLMYRLAMDEGRANRLGAAPLRPELARIDAVRDAKGLLREIAHLETIGVGAGFIAGPNGDDKDTTRLLYAFGQPSSILGDRDLYLGSDARAKTARAQYLKTEGAFLCLAGLPEAGAAQALSLETALARVSSTPVALRDPAAVAVRYRDLDEMRTVADAMVGQFTVTVHFEDADRDDVRSLMPSFVRMAGRVVANGFPPASR